MEYWLHKTQQCTRAQPCFTICKDGKAGDHRGRPASIHFWSDAAEQLFAACVRDLNNNDLSEEQAGADWVVLQRRKGFSIGGHLSAAYVELVAPQHKHLCEWPSTLDSNEISVRFRRVFS